MRAADHARIASTLLESIDTFQQRIRAMSPEERLAFAAGGGVKIANADIDYTIALAQAHALTASAMIAAGVIHTDDPSGCSKVRPIRPEVAGDPRGEADR